MIPEEVLDAIRSASWDVFIHYIPTRGQSAGRGNFSTNCPLGSHDDTQASFSFNPEKGMFNCFACGASGDVFKFVTLMEGCDFREACSKAADLAGVRLDRGMGKPKTADEIESGVRHRNARRILSALAKWHLDWVRHWSMEVFQRRKTVDYCAETLANATERLNESHWLLTSCEKNYAAALNKLCLAEHMSECFEEVSGEIDKQARLFVEMYAPTKI